MVGYFLHLCRYAGLQAMLLVQLHLPSVTYVQHAVAQPVARMLVIAPDAQAVGVL